MSKTNTLQNVSLLKVLLNCIALRARTQPEIIEITGLSNSTVSRWLRFLHVCSKDSKNIVYIEEWKRVGKRGNWSACWKLGYGMADTPKPKPLTSSQYNRLWREKNIRDSLGRKITQTETGTIHVTI